MLIRHLEIPNVKFVARDKQFWERRGTLYLALF
jgi:hypothetical protein